MSSPHLVDYSQINIGQQIKQTIYTRTERISIFLNGIIIMILLGSLCFLYYRYLNKEENEKIVNKKIRDINNLIYS